MSSESEVRLIDYLIRLSEDPAEGDRWLRRRDQTIVESQLSIANKQILLENDFEAIERVVQEEDQRAHIGVERARHSKRRRHGKSYVTVSWVTVSLAEDDG